MSRWRLNGRSLPLGTRSSANSELVAQEIVPAELPDGRRTEFSVMPIPFRRRYTSRRSDGEGGVMLSNDRQVSSHLSRGSLLIHEADWLHSHQKEPHPTLLRVEFSFD